MPSTGNERVFAVIELKRVGGSTSTSLQPTGVEFRWSRENFAAPRAAWNFGIEQRTVRKDLPGAEEPVEQVLGWNYTPFTINGRWDDRYGGSGFAMQQFRDFMAMVKRGNFVRVQFEQLAIIGIVKSFQPSYKRKDCIDYSFTVSPHFTNEGESVRQEVNPKRRILTDPVTSVQLCRLQLDAIRDAHAVARASNLSRVQSLINNDLFAEVNADFDEVSRYITQAEFSVSKGLEAPDGAAQALLRGAQAMTSVRGVVQRTLSRLRGIVSTTTLAIDTFDTALDFRVWVSGVQYQMRLLGLQAFQTQQDLRLRAEPKPKRLHRARQGESLYAISTRYYGTPHRWREILQANNLSSLILQGGELLVIPE
jgi:hypothetical protein